MTFICNSYVPILCDSNVVRSVFGYVYYIFSGSISKKSFLQTCLLFMYEGQHQYTDKLSLINTCKVDYYMN